MTHTANAIDKRSNEGCDVDLSVLSELHELVGEAFYDIADTYMKDADQLLSRMGEALDAGDCERLARAAHQLKSSSGSLGGVGLAALMQRIETTATAGATNDMAAALEQAGAYFKRLCAHLTSGR